MFSRINFRVVSLEVSYIVVERLKRRVLTELKVTSYLCDTVMCLSVSYSKVKIPRFSSNLGQHSKISCVAAILR